MPSYLRPCWILASLALLLVPAAGMRAADEVGVFFDAAATDRVQVVPAFNVQQVCVMLLSPSQNPQGFELSVELPAGWTILSVHHGPPGCLQSPPADPFDLQAGLCTDCEDPTPTQVGLMRIELGWFAGGPAPTNAMICLGPYSASSFNPATPGYASCTDALIPLGYVADLELCEGPPPLPGNCAVVNPDVDCGLAANSRSWSGLKSSF
jgi:hypothetical protein